MPTMFVMQGIPGGGKSYVAKLIAKHHQATIVTADTFHGLYEPDGTFHAELLPDAHVNSFRNACRAVAAKKSVVVDNTNLVVQEVTPYIVMAHTFGFSVELVRVPCSQKVAFARQTHGVPEETHKKMFRRFQSFKLPHYWPVRVRSAKHVLAELGC